MILIFWNSKSGKTKSLNFGHFSSFAGQFDNVSFNLSIVNQILGKKKTYQSGNYQIYNVLAPKSKFKKLDIILEMMN